MNYKYTYKRPGNDCYISDTLEITNERLIHTVLVTGAFNEDETKVINNKYISKEGWIARVLEYMMTSYLYTTNFIELSTTIKEYLDE